MKTQSEWLNDHHAIKRGEEQIKVAKITALLARIGRSGWAVYEPPAEKNDRSDYDLARINLRHELAAIPRRFAVLNITCDRCLLPLVDTDVGSARASNPPCFQAQCAGCGQSTWLPLAARSAE